MPIRKQRRSPCLWLVETFLTSPLASAEQNFRKLDRKQVLNILYQVCVFESNGCPCLWLAETFSTSLTAIAIRNLTKLDWKQVLNILYQVGVFLLIRKQRWSPRPLFGRDIFSSTTAEWNLMKLDRKQALNFLYYMYVCFWGPISKQRLLPLLSCFWLADTFSTLPLQLLNGTMAKLDMKQVLKVI